MVQQPDSKPGAYYVSVRRGASDWRPLVGPFWDDHAAALALVDKAQAKATDLDPRACWYYFGTVRLDVDRDAAPAGILNSYFPDAVGVLEAA